MMICNICCAAIGYGAVLSWKQNIERDLAGYKVYHGYSPGNYIHATDVGMNTSCDLSRLILMGDITYYICVTAYDYSGNESGFSAYVTFLADDEIFDRHDNCPEIYNPEQDDSDLDGSGDVCDLDDDGDQFLDEDDNCPTDANPDQEDADLDKTGDSCDNCPAIPNADQFDSYPPQGNRIGDACDCEGNFDADRDVDTADLMSFKKNFGRNNMINPCTNLLPCNGDLNCDRDVDVSDMLLFYEDFGRNNMINPCPPRVSGMAWCSYQ
jgi:hypothetical protein